MSTTRRAVRGGTIGVSRVAGQIVRDAVIGSSGLRLSLLWADTSRPGRTPTTSTQKLSRGDGRRRPMDATIAASHSQGQGPQVLAAAADGIIPMIAALGGDVDRIFGEVRVDIGLLNSPFNELSLAQYCRLFEEAARQTGYDNFGLRFGHGFTPRQLGPLGYMAINSPTMAAGLRALVDYMPAHQQNTTMALRRERDLLYLDYQITDGRISRRRQDSELSLGMFCNIFHHCHGKHWTPLEIHFEHPQPLDGREHETLFGAPVFFAQPTNSIVFPERDLDAPMPDPDSYLFSLLEPFMRGLQRRACSDDLVGG